MSAAPTLNCLRRWMALAVLSLGFAGCAIMEPDGALRKELVFAVTERMDLIKFNAGQPRRILERKALSGIQTGDRLVGIDFRVARGVLYALAQSGRIYTIDTSAGVAKLVDAPPLDIQLAGDAIGFDFNPAVDRMRVVTSAGQNLRIHPDTGRMIDGAPAVAGVQPDQDLSYAPGDAHAGRRPNVAGAAYTYNKQNEKITTLYVIDRALGNLAMQGSKEGMTPFVSPDTGQLRTIGSLGLGALSDAAFDISDISNAPLAAVRTVSNPQTRLYLLDLGTGRATSLGRVADGSPVIGIAIEP